jgi:hypothetical protein
MQWMPENNGRGTKAITYGGGSRKTGVESGRFGEFLQKIFFLFG